VLIASSARIERELHWRAEHRDLESILRSAWDWMRRREGSTAAHSSADATAAR
jgi:UDP-glucose 4-epimerase